MVSPSRSTLLKKAKAIESWPLPRTFSANAARLDDLVRGGVRLDADYDPRRLERGLGDPVHGRGRGPVPGLSVSTYRPYGIMRNAVFFAWGSTGILLCGLALWYGDRGCTRQRDLG